MLGTRSLLPAFPFFAPLGPPFFIFAMLSPSGALRRFFFFFLPLFLFRSSSVLSLSLPLALSSCDPGPLVRLCVHQTDLRLCPSHFAPCPLRSGRAS